MTGSQWTERYVELPDTDPFPGKFSYRRTPAARGIADACTDPQITAVTVIKATQLLGTTSIFNRIGWGIVNRYGNKLYVMASKEAAKELIDDRLRPFLESCPATRPLIAYGPGAWGKSRFKFRTGTLHVASASSKSDRRSKTVWELYLDEVAIFPPGVAKLFLNRTDAVPQPFVMVVSSPVHKDDPAWKSYQAGTREEWWVPCPFHQCRTYQVLDFRQIRWATDNPLKADEEARYVCVACGRSIPDDAREEMQQGGEWRPRAQVHDHRSFIISQLNSLNLPKHRWGSFARRFLECYPVDDDGNKIPDSDPYPEDLQEFYNSALCWLWEELGGSLSDTELEALRDTYTRGCLPISAAQIVAAVLTVDVQKWGLKWECDLWGAHETSYLFDYGYERFDVNRLSGKPVLQLERACDVETRLNAQLDGEDLLVTHRFMDSGDETVAVYEFCKRYRWAATKGERTDAGVKIWRLGDTDKVTGLKPLLFQAGKFKDRLAQRFRIPLDRPGSWHLPRDTETKFIREVCGEKRLDDGTWVPVRGRRHDYLDTRVLQEVACRVLRMRARVPLVATKRAKGPNEPPPREHPEDSRGTLRRALRRQLAERIRATRR